MERRYKGPKKQAVSLTSLLDLLFVMIFVSLIQQKNPPIKKESVTIKKPVPIVKPLNYDIKAIFHFYSSQSNSKLPSGKYRMKGTFKEKTQDLKLGGVAWIKRPERYDMVPLSGKIDPKKDLFTGKIDAPGCKTFSLKRSVKTNSTPVSGKWKGSYSCGQGKTGLTLTIE